MDLQRRVAEATKLGRGVAETALLDRELDVVQRSRRDIGEKISHKLQELRDGTAQQSKRNMRPPIWTRKRGTELSEQIVSAHRVLAKLAASGKSQTDEAAAVRERVLLLQKTAPKLSLS